MSPPSHSSSKDDSTGDGQHRLGSEQEENIFFLLKGKFRGFAPNLEENTVAPSNITSIQLYLLYKNVPIVKIKD